MKMMNVFSIGLILIMMLVMVAQADAGLRVRATVRTPVVSAHFGGGHSHVSVRLPVRTPARLAVSQRDRVIARRLSDATGLRTRTILRLRADGLRWNRIGRVLDLPRPMVRAAMDGRSWNRYLHRDDRRPRCAYRH